MRRMICDVPNLFFRAVKANMTTLSSLMAEDAVPYALYICLMSLRKHYNNIKPQELAVVFEGSKNWRKAYTASEECYSQRPYKGNRVKDPEFMEIFAPVVDQFKDLCKNFTSIPVFTHEQLEGDDCISGYVQKYTDDEVIILSGDKDFVQLLAFPHVKLINPDLATERTVESVCGIDDAKYFLFEKCIRGDAGDNVISALPKIRATKLQKAFGVNGASADLVELNKIFQQVWELPSSEEDGGVRKMETAILFAENEMLMDLTAQPDFVKEFISEALSATPGRYNEFNMIRKLTELKLVSIADDIDKFSPMFSNSAFKNVRTQGTEIKRFEVRKTTPGKFNSQK